MFCPQCRAEYLQGVRECADCGIPLVVALPEPPAREQPADLELVEVLATFNPGDIALLKSVLDANGIDYLFQGEHFATVQPMVDPARLFVSREQLTQARELVDSLDLNFSAIRHPRPEAGSEDPH